MIEADSDYQYSSCMSSPYVKGEDDISADLIIAEK